MRFMYFGIFVMVDIIRFLLWLLIVVLLFSLIGCYLFFLEISVLFCILKLLWFLVGGLCCIILVCVFIYMILFRLCILIFFLFDCWGCNIWFNVLGISGCCFEEWLLWGGSFLVIRFLICLFGFVFDNCLSSVFICFFFRFWWILVFWVSLRIWVVLGIWLLWGVVRMVYFVMLFLLIWNLIL